MSRTTPPSSATSTSTLFPPPATGRSTSPRPHRSSGPATRMSPSPPLELHPSSFAPPFYNRPPTPLPPSPSLTSLLRPPFTPSRPTTPDSSDSEGITHSSALSSRTSRYAPKVPTYEYYGFMLYTISSFAFAMYMIWSYSPAIFLEALGIYYYPSRWWSLALPSYLVAVVCYIFAALAGYNTTVLTHGLGALETVVDVGGNIAAFQRVEECAEGHGGDDDGGGCVSPISPLGLGGGKGEGEGSRKSEKWGDMVRCSREEGRTDWTALWSRGTDAVMDVPIGGVCEVLYGDGRERAEWETGLEGG